MDLITIITSSRLQLMANNVKLLVLILLVMMTLLNSVLSENYTSVEISVNTLAPLRSTFHQSASLSACLTIIKTNRPLTDNRRFFNQSNCELGFGETVDSVLQPLIVIPINYTWPDQEVKLRLRLAQRSYVSDNLVDYTDHTVHLKADEEDLLIKERTHDWNMTLAVRLRCAENYYGPRCQILCKPNDNVLGHWTCDSIGSIQCLQGWRGTSCDKPICSPGCYHGTCRRPNECRCLFGWNGTECRAPVCHPDCVQSQCSKPFGCNCKNEWGGAACNVQMNPCKPKPCEGKKSICLPIFASDPFTSTYECKCQPGRWGLNCEYDNIENFIAFNDIDGINNSSNGSDENKMTRLEIASIILGILTILVVLLGSLFIGFKFDLHLKILSFFNQISNPRRETLFGNELKKGLRTELKTFEKSNNSIEEDDNVSNDNLTNSKLSVAKSKTSCQSSSVAIDLNLVECHKFNESKVNDIEKCQTLKKIKNCNETKPCNSKSTH